MPEVLNFMNWMRKELKIEEMFETVKVDDKQNRALNEVTELIYQEQLSERPEQMGDYKKRMSRYMISRIEKFIVTTAVGGEVQRLRRLF